MSLCPAVNCKNRGIHVFPKDFKRRKQWVKALRRKNWQPSNCSRICADHFKTDDYHEKNSYTGDQNLHRVLKKTAVPSIFSYNKVKPENPIAQQLERSRKKLTFEKIYDDRIPGPSGIQTSLGNFKQNVNNIEPAILILKKDAVPSKFSWNEQSFGTTKAKAYKKHVSTQRCSVLQCKSASDKNVILHSCPSHETVRKKWSEVFKVSRDVVKNMLICSQHFLKTDYLNTRNGDGRTLKQNAVPSQKLPRSTRVVHLRKNVTHSQKKNMRQKVIKKEEKMTDVAEEENVLDQETNIHECRACLKKMAVSTSVCNLFQSWALPWVDMGSTIAEDLAKLANVEVSEVDDYPKVICAPCYQKLLDASIFVAKVKSSDCLLRQRILKDSPDKVWPKPIQVDKNLNGEVFQDVEIKKEVVSDEEYELPTAENSFVAENAYMEPELCNMEIKIEPEEFVEPPPLTITINGTMSLNPLNPESKTLINGTQEYEAIITECVGNTTLTNGTEQYNNEQFLETSIKEEPVSEDEEREDLSLECMLCAKLFNSVSGLKAHVIAQHSYKSVKRKADGSESPEKKQREEYKCEICKRYFVTSTDLMVHETCHNKHACYGCSRKFDTFKQLMKHRKHCQAQYNSTVTKPKTLDDVLRPVKEEKMDTSDVESPACQEDDSSMKLHLEIHSNKSESGKSETEECGSDAGTSTETLNEDSTK